MGKAIYFLFFYHVERKGLLRHLRFGFLKFNIEGFVRVYLSAILQLNISTSCQACKAHSETLMHILRVCPSYAVSSYLLLHNAVLSVVYFHLRHAYSIDAQTIILYAPIEISP